MMHFSSDVFTYIALERFTEPVIPENEVMQSIMFNINKFKWPTKNPKVLQIWVKDYFYSDIKD